MKKYLILSILIISIIMSVSTVASAARKAPKKINVTGVLKKTNGKQTGYNFLVRTANGTKYLLKTKNIKPSFLNKKVGVKGVQTRAGKARAIKVSFIAPLPSSFTGTLNKSQFNIYMQGSPYYVRDEEGNICILRKNGSIDYEEFLGKKVTVSGKTNLTVTGSIPVMSVVTINEWVALTGTITEPDFYYVQIAGLSMAYLQSGENKYILSLTDKTQNLKAFTGQQVEISGLLSSEELVIVKTIKTVEI